MTGPLDGRVVLALERSVAATITAGQRADAGARVIKRLSLSIRELRTRHPRVVEGIDTAMPDLPRLGQDAKAVFDWRKRSQEL